ASNIDKALVMVAWPTDDFWDISRTRRLGVLVSVLGDRLRREIREELGATYSPVVYNRSSRIDPGYGILQSMIIVDPQQVELLAEKLTDVGGRLAREGVEQEELQRALEPTLTSIRDMMRTNRYWLESVLSLSSRHPQQLQWPLSIRKDFSSITAADISEFAARYLQPDKSAGFFAYPADEK
ncbi:MAG: insulinase family protein, partial [Desulfobulbaceae bacterium]|nr:insulinase family protein [Desulfobulbaceae bacterium]